MAGRPRKPDHLKVLHGDRKDRINDDAPLPMEGEIVPSFELSGEGQANWDRLAPDRIAQGVLTAWDADAFAQFCEALVVARRAVGAVMMSDGPPKPGSTSPVAEWQKAINVCSTLGGRFGWTPSDRAKLTTGGSKDGPSEKRLLS